jgi:hypothetical protein
MTCTETRDLFSALADDALTPAERAALDAHLAGCAECRRELAAFGRTVALVRAIDPAHAPAGFVDRVLAAAWPEPWPRWLVRRLSAPWPTLPLGAAALLLVAGLAVLLFRASPEPQQTARYQSAPPAPAPAPTRETTPSGASDTLQDASRDAGASATATREVAPAAPPPAAHGPEPPARADDGKVAKNRLEQAAPAAKSAETSVEPTAPARDAPPPAEPRAMTERQTVAPPTALEGRRAKVDSIARDTVKEGKLQQAAAPLSRTGPMTGILATPPDVTAQLRAADVSVVERSLIELAARLGGRQTGRRIDGGRVVVELAVPREAYAQFVREATALGPLSLEQQTTDRPLLSVAVTVSN